MFTPEKREQLILEQMSFPGAPTSEGAAWRRFPQRARVAIRRLHRAFGHLSGKVLKQVLRQSKASKEFILDFTGARLACTPPHFQDIALCQVSQCSRKNLIIRSVWIALK